MFGLLLGALTAAQGTAQRITANYSELPAAVEKADRVLSNNLELKLMGFKRKEAAAVLSNSFIQKHGDDATRKNLKEVADKQDNSGQNSFRTLLNPQTATDDDDVTLSLNRDNLIGSFEDRLKPKDLIDISFGNGKKSQEIRIAVPESIPKPADKKSDTVTYAWPGKVICSKPLHAGRFISGTVMGDGDKDFLFGIQNCFDSKQKRKLAGEYVLLYDYRTGDYYPFKKTIRKPSALDSPQCNKKYVEYYRQIKSPFFSPGVGSQFKVELMNYNDTVPLSLDIVYRDNFLAEESRFQSLLSAFQQGPKKTGDTARKPANTEQALNTDKTKALEYCALLVQLLQELCYYTSNFNYNSYTTEIHQQNIQLIAANIRKEFELDNGQEIVQGIAAKVEGVPGSDKQIQSLQLFINKLNNFQSIVYTAFRVKNRDNVILQFKDDRGRMKKEEELRISNGFKIDFSTGAFLTGLKDEVYKFKDTTVAYLPSGATTAKDTTGKFILRENASKRKVGFGILAHAYPRLSSNYNLGIATGFSVNTETEINLLAGLSLMLGSERRVVFTGGFIWGKANRLSKTVYQGLNRKDPDVPTSAPVFYVSTDSVVPVVNDWQRSWFLGVSYNFSAR